MEMKEAMEKTGVLVLGLVVGVNEYISKKTGLSYRSVDLTVKGCRQAVNVKLPPGYPVNTLHEYELVKLPVTIRPNYQRTGLELEAVEK